VGGWSSEQHERARHGTEEEGLDERNQILLVERLLAFVEERCDWVEVHRGQPDGMIQLAAYALWRTNWIHPFRDGNGRVARAICYLVLCVERGELVRGNPSLPERIYDATRRYYHCLEDADLAWKRRKVNVNNMTGFLASCIRAMTIDAARAAGISLSLSSRSS
jgi:Fic family protein